MSLLTQPPSRDGGDDTVDLAQLIGRRFFDVEWGIFEIAAVRDTHRGPFAQVGCRVLEWTTGQPDRRFGPLMWLEAHHVLDTLRVQDEPEPRYPITTRPPSPPVRALITGTGCRRCGNPDVPPGGPCGTCDARRV